MYKNSMKLQFISVPENEAFARVAVAAFVTQLDPTIEEIADIKTAVSEAVTNAIVHGYEFAQGIVEVECNIYGLKIEIIVRDSGVGIKDVEKAKEPLYTTKSELERSGMGFVFMEVFMDSLEVISSSGEGTTVIMKKTLIQEEEKLDNN